ncbi:hypothetical protein [Actinoallomurus sp. CA-142502]|uniref:hypothetical protein n=1 Tax=Actinoallomurus sp. CA-142502 TaxID=3239885 RepID=UPI003D8FAC1C
MSLFDVVLKNFLKRPTAVEQVAKDVSHAPAPEVIARTTAAQQKLDAIVEQAKAQHGLSRALLDQYAPAMTETKRAVDGARKTAGSAGALHPFYYSSGLVGDPRLPRSMQVELSDHGKAAEKAIDIAGRVEQHLDRADGLLFKAGSTELRSVGLSLDTGGLREARAEHRRLTEAHDEFNSQARNNYGHIFGDNARIYETPKD